MLDENTPAPPTADDFALVNQRATDQALVLDEGAGEDDGGIDDDITDPDADLDKAALQDVTETERDLENDADDVGGSDLDFDVPGHEWTDADKPNLEAFGELITDLGLGQDGATRLLEFVCEKVDEGKSAVAELDERQIKATKAELKAEWGTDYKAQLTAIDDMLHSLPKATRDLIVSARGGQGGMGRRLFHEPGFVRLLADYARLKEAADEGPPEGGSTSVGRYEARLRRELRELTHLRDTDIAAYWRPWKGTGKTGSDRFTEITRELAAVDAGAPGSTPAEKARALAREKQEIEDLRESDPELFEFSSWRTTGLTPAQRLEEILRKGSRAA